MSIDAAVQKAAEALWLDTYPDIPWNTVRDVDQLTYEGHARAVFDALGLTEETRCLDDGEGGMSTNYKTGEGTVHSRPRTRQQRLVTPWGTA